MNKLFKANLYKLTKEKSIYVLSIITACTVAWTTLLYYIINGMSVGSSGNEFTAEILFLQAVQFGQNMGVLLAIGIAIYIGNEFSHHTIRNKIAIGYSKTMIFLSNLIMSVVISLIIYLVYQFIVLCLALPLFGWSNDGFSFSAFLRSIINSLFMLITFSAVLNLVCMLLRSKATGILTSILLVVFGFLFFTILSAIPFTGVAEDIIEILIKITVFGQSLLIVGTNSVSFMLYVVISSIISTAGLSTLGCFLFEKMDIK